MHLIVGLGNPGKKYQQTRHNLGFAVLENWPEDEYRRSVKFNAAILKTAEAIWARPQTFMNNSGEAISKISRYYKIGRGGIWIIHDDIDLPLGSLRISSNSSSAGHRGVQSAIDALGSSEFTRFRIGIANGTQGATPTEDYVLQKFQPGEESAVAAAVSRTRRAVIAALEQGIDQSIKQFSS